MAQNFNTVFPSNSDAPTTDYPMGSAVNDTFDGAGDGFPLEKRLVNEIFGILGAIMQAAGKSTSDLSGAVEKATSSQYFTWLRGLTTSITKLQGNNGDVALLNNNASIRFSGGSTDAKLFLNGAGPNVQDYFARIGYYISSQLYLGGLYFGVVTGGSDSHMRSNEYSISTTYLTYSSTTQEITMSNGSTGILFSAMKWITRPISHVDLILTQTNAEIIIPMACEILNNGSDLVKINYGVGRCPVPSPISGGYTAARLKIWYDPEVYQP